MEMAVKVCGGIVSLFLNLGLMIGLILGALILLRPILVRVLTPQQRAVLWLVAWIPAYLPAWYRMTNWIALLPVTFRDLVVPRTGPAYDVPAFLPGAYGEPGTYHLALPGGELVPVTLTDGFMVLLTVIWIIGVVVLCWYDIREWGKRKALAAQARRLPEDDPVFAELMEQECSKEVEVYLCPDLPTSFVERNGMGQYEVYLQEELSGERMHLVLRHEFQHIRLYHCLFKFIANVGIPLYWWNPLIWLGYRYFCRDLELACDAAVMKQLDAGERKEYAKTLVELGTGRQLWEAPLSFGECDAEVRVRAAVGWKPRKWWSVLLTWCLTFLTVLFFLGGPSELYRGQDLRLMYEQGWSTSSFEELMKNMVGEEGVPIQEVWYRQEGGAVFIRTERGDWHYSDVIWWNGGRSFYYSASEGAVEGTPDLTGYERIY